MPCAAKIIIMRGLLKIHAAVCACSKQRIGQQEQPGAPCVGLIVQYPPFDRAGSCVAVLGRPVAEVDIVISIRIVIAGDPARVNLNCLTRAAGILPICRDRGIGGGHGKGGACAGNVGKAAPV